MAKERIVTLTVLQVNPSFTAAIDALDAQNTIQMNLVITTPPAGYQEQSFRVLGPMGMFFDGTNYNVWQSFSYTVIS
jgi:hypothetical protein